MDKLIDKIKVESRSVNDRNSSALIAIKISIERLLKELLHPQKSKMLIKTLTYFDERNMSQELLIACAEIHQPQFEVVCCYHSDPCSGSLYSGV